jgi:DNA ligase 1
VKQFSALFNRLDSTTSTNEKVQALTEYWLQAHPADAAWACFLLAGGKTRQSVPTKVLRQAAAQISGVSDWLFDESYQQVGDLSETIAHLLPAQTESSQVGLAQWVEQKILPLKGMSVDDQIAALSQYWAALPANERFLLNKLLTGGFRVGVSKLLVLRSLAQAFGIDSQLIAQRFVGYTDAKTLPNSKRFEALIAQGGDDNFASNGKPFPFFLAHPLKDEVDTLGPLNDWQAEWKWDGIRAQLVVHENVAALWSRGEELISESFPELMAIAKALPVGTVLDGEILAWSFADDQPQPFAQLQQRTTRKKLSVKMLKEIPTVFVCYDLLQLQGQDIRQQTLRERRQKLEQVVAQTAHAHLKISPVIEASSWIALAHLRDQARTRLVEGLMLKSLQSVYGAGRLKNVTGGDWWKWKLDPLTVDAILLYAQTGHGKRATLYTDYTFAVWDDNPDPSARKLLPFAKAYSGLTDAQINQVDAIIKRTTIEKFGPVRSVTPTMVFELAFEGIQLSKRHKAGIAVRFPRMLRWRTDKTVEQADTIATLRALITDVRSVSVK